MGVVRRIAFVLLTATILALAACGGTGSILDTQSLDEWSPTAPPGETDGTGLTGLPEIPLDTGEPDKSSSAAEGLGTSMVLGCDYLQMQGSYVEETALVIGGAASDATGGDGTAEPGRPPAYGLYKIAGLLGQRPLSLNIECIPQNLGDNYYVGVADYTEGVWRWFGPCNLPEFELDLRGVNHQLVTHLGNMYFILVCAPDNVATHYRSTVIAGTPDPDGMPGFPHHLVASDGQFPEAVGLSWVAGGGAARYQVFRRDARPESEWEMIGATEDTKYKDAPLPDYKLFFYRVRSMNAAGESCWSNMDSGFAGGGADPCVIKGDITTVNGEPVGGIKVGLVGFGEHMLRVTNEDGRFYFGDLPPGRYIAAPYHADLDFFPRYHAVDLTEEKLADIHFNAVPSAVFHRVWGFAFTFADEDTGGGRFEPMAGVEISCRPVGQPGEPWTAETNEHGFWIIEELPEGIYLATAREEGFSFFPPVHEVVINNYNPPDRCDFLGHPVEGGDPADE
jgi:hypothetical protein